MTDDKGREPRIVTARAPRHARRPAAPSPEPKAGRIVKALTPARIARDRRRAPLPKPEEGSDT